MSACIAGREVVIRLRHRVTKRLRLAHVVCPSGWSKARLLAYCRREHPDETVVIAEWRSVSDVGVWNVRLWIVNPKEMIGNGEWAT